MFIHSSYSSGNAQMLTVSIQKFTRFMMASVNTGENSLPLEFRINGCSPNWNKNVSIDREISGNFFVY